MKRLVCAALAVAFVGLLSPSNTSAQAVFVGGGVTIPTGDFADFDGSGSSDEGAKTGWQASGGVLFPVGDAGLSVGARGFYGSNNHDFEGDKTNLYGGGVVGTFAFGDAEAVSPFVFAELGYQAHAYKSDDFPEDEETDWNPFLGGGVGLGFPLGGIRGFVAVNYTQGLGADSDAGESNTTYLGGSAGVNIPLGGM